MPKSEQRYTPYVAFFTNRNTGMMYSTNVWKEILEFARSNDWERITQKEAAIRFTNNNKNWKDNVQV